MTCSTTCVLCVCTLYLVAKKNCKSRWDFCGLLQFPAVSIFCGLILVTAVYSVEVIVHQVTYVSHCWSGEACCSRARSKVSVFALGLVQGKEARATRQRKVEKGSWMFWEPFLSQVLFCLIFVTAPWSGYHFIILPMTKMPGEQKDVAQDCTDGKWWFQDLNSSLPNSMFYFVWAVPGYFPIGLECENWNLCIQGTRWLCELERAF